MANTPSVSRIGTAESDCLTQVASLPSFTPAITSELLKQGINPVTPAVESLKNKGTSFKLHEYRHDPSASSYGEEAAEKLGVEFTRVFKTLVVSGEDRSLYVAVIPISGQLNLKAMAKAVGVKKLAMADKKLVEKTTGYVLGGVSPLGQKKPLITVVDETAQDFETIYVSAGKRGLEIEIACADLIYLTNARTKLIGK